MPTTLQTSPSVVETRCSSRKDSPNWRMPSRSGAGKTSGAIRAILSKNYCATRAKPQLLKYIDVLVDGKFKKELRDEELYFRGSRNQRLIDVQTSLQKDETVIYHYNPKKGI